MKKTLLSLILLFTLLGCGTKVSVKETLDKPIVTVPITEGSLVLNFSKNSLNSLNLRNNLIAKGIERNDVTSTEKISFLFGIKGNESGILTLGNSSIKGNTMGFGIQKYTENGYVGSMSSSEEFTLPNPSIINLGNLQAGSKWSPPYGNILVEFGGDKTTVLNTVRRKGLSGDVDLSEVDEIVLRTSTYAEDSDAIMISQPHFVAHSEQGSKVYSSKTNNLFIDNEKMGLDSFELVLFVPASIVGKDFSWFVSAKDYNDNTVSSPVINSYDEKTYQFKPFSEWIKRDDWKTDNVGNNRLFEMFDNIAGIEDISERTTSLKWQALAEYFQDFFIKNYRAGATMFNMKQGNQNHGGIGNNGRASFLVIALDDSQGKVKMGQNSRVELGFDIDKTILEKTNDIINLSGKPPLYFKTKIVN